MKYHQTHTKGGAKGIAAGFSSNLEQRVAVQLRTAKVPFEYEAHTIRYTKPAEEGRYTPDFILPNGIIIEVKGLWETADRKKHRIIRDQFPDLDIRFVFSKSNTTIGSKSSTTYAMYCLRLGIPCSDRQIPAEWLAEKPTKARLSALKAATRQ
jgi:hypothetical protein